MRQSFEARLLLTRIKDSRRMIDQTEVRRNWDVTKEKLKQKYGILVDSDLVWKDGKLDDMLYKLNIILGVSAEDLKKFISGS